MPLNRYYAYKKRRLGGKLQKQDVLNAPDGYKNNTDDLIKSFSQAAKFLTEQ
jgi:hypothetical protein